MPMTLALRNKKAPQITSVLAALGLVLFVALACHAQSAAFEGNPEVRPYTVDLPSIDRVELLKLKKVGDLWNGEIEATKSVDAQKIASLWRAQTYFPYMAACHFPGYAVKFYSGEKLITFATLCWECNNIGFKVPEIQGTQSFGGRDRNGKRLLKVFRTAFHETTK
jgi:hypothetical protein